MRTECKVAALSLAVLLGACSKRPDQTAGLSDDLKKDLAAASASNKDFAIVPQTYKRMRFVSDIEQTRATELALRPKISRSSHRLAMQPTSEAAPDPIVSMASHQLMTVSTTTSTAEAPVTIAARPAPEPTTVTAGSGSEGAVGDNNRGSGLGGLLGGIGVVIRGGHAGGDKCDPRPTPGQIGRPDFGLPLPTGQVFGGGGRH
jgi:hypothetical protein